MMILAVIGYVVGNVVCHLLGVLGISMFFQVKAGITFFYWCVLVCYQMGVLLVPVTVFVRKKGFWTGGMRL
jgi:Ca2+/Na+ antiporter